MCHYSQFELIAERYTKRLAGEKRSCYFKTGCLKMLDIWDGWWLAVCHSRLLSIQNYDRKYKKKKAALKQTFYLKSIEKLRAK